MTTRRDEWPDWEENPPGPRKIIKWILVAIAIILTLSFVGWLWSVTFGNGAKIAQRATDPDRLIATYEGYYEACTSVVAMDANIATARETYDDTRKQAGADPLGLKAQDVQQARTNLLGMQQRRREIAADYNAKSLEITRLNGITKGDDLPAQIVEGVTPQCGHNQPEIGS